MSENFEAWNSFHALICSLVNNYLLITHQHSIQAELSDS